MAKFAGQPTRKSAPIQTVSTVPDTTTFEGAPAYNRDMMSELFLLAVTNMVSEPTFYESGSTRDERFIRLIHNVTHDEPEWMQKFIPWLRHGALMRSASVQAAAEYAKAGGPGARQVIANTLSRPDEPGELLAYWFNRYGRALPASVKRGVADAAQRLYTEKAALKYDGKGNDWRLADVIQLCHVKPKDEDQSILFKYLLDRRYGSDTAGAFLQAFVDTNNTPPLPYIHRRLALEAIIPDQRRAMLDQIGAGETWEWLSGWLPGGMDAEAWEAIIPHMGYMALLRNLRNFDEAGINSAMALSIANKLADYDEVARSRQFPYRFWSAYKHTGSLRYAGALEAALELSVKNIPQVGGRTLVLTDTSGSMSQPVSARSKIAHFEIAGVFAAAMASACDDVTLVSWADKWTDLGFKKGDSILRTVEKLAKHNGHDGHGTELVQAVTGAYNGHDRIVIFSDMQVNDMYRWRNPAMSVHDVLAAAGVPVFVFNTGGYKATPVQSGQANVYEMGGFTDSVFRMIPLVENRGVWPWEN